VIAAKRIRPFASSLLTTIPWALTKFCSPRRHEKATVAYPQCSLKLAIDAIHEPRLFEKLVHRFAKKIGPMAPTFPTNFATRLSFSADEN
jgi:hypothetical protein